MGEGRVTLRDTKTLVDDPKHLRRARINRMHVDESGDHCFLLSDTAFFYNNWHSKIAKKIDLFKSKYFAGVMCLNNQSEPKGQLEPRLRVGLGLNSSAHLKEINLGSFNEPERKVLTNF